MGQQLLAFQPVTGVAIGQTFTVNITHRVIRDASEAGANRLSLLLFFNNSELSLDSVTSRNGFVIQSQLPVTVTTSDNNNQDSNTETNRRYSVAFTPLDVGATPYPDAETVVLSATFTALTSFDGSSVSVLIPNLNAQSYDNAPAEVLQPRTLPIPLLAIPTLAIAPTTATQNEGNSGTTPFTFTVTRSGDTTGVSSANYAVTGNAADGADFGGVTLPITGTVSFAAGETSKVITVPVSGDTLVEPDETFTITLSSPTNATITTPTATGTITNDDTALAIAATAATQNEGNTATTPFTFTVTRTGVTTGTSSASYAVTGNAADGTDFGGVTLPTGTVSFAAGETSQVITVPVSADTVFEPDETFSITLSSPTNATITTATATGTITNDDVPPPALAIAATDARKNEGNTGNTAFTFTVTRTGDTTGISSAAFAVTGTGTNLADAADFGGTLATGTVTFAAGATTQVVTVNVTGDTTVELDETFAVTLSSPTNATITTAIATGTIVNEDVAPPTLAIAATDARKNEGNSGNTAFTFTVTRSGDTTGVSSATFTVTGTGTNPADAADFGGTLATGTVTFAAGATTQVVTVNVTGDTIFEVDETFAVTLSSPTNATIATAIATGTIVNDDPAPIFAISAASATEGGLINFTVTRTTGNVQATQQVVVTTSIATGNTAIATDFTPKTETLAFATGETTKVFSVQTTQDSLFETNETFTATLSAPTNGATISASNASAIGTINNDDVAPSTTATLSRVNNDIFSLSGSSSSKLKVSFTDAGSSSINELGVFSVDDATGRIGSFAVGSAGYAQAALERSKVIFSAIANKPSGFTPNSNSLIDATLGNLRFYLIKSGTTTEEALKSNNFSNVLFGSSSARITDSGNGSFAIAWEDGSGNNSFNSLRINAQGSDESAIGTNLQGNSFGGRGGGEVIDLRAAGLPTGTRSITADFTVNREAAFNNFVGFYKVANTDGGIDIDGNGTIDFTPGQNGYIQAAIRSRVSGIDLAVSNQGTAQITGKTFEVNSIFAPFIIVNGTADTLLDSNSSNDPSVYFSYLGANTDGVDHIRMLGNNTFGFEDLSGGGDRDFNDVIIKATLTAVR